MNQGTFVRGLTGGQAFTYEGFRYTKYGKINVGRNIQTYKCWRRNTNPPCPAKVEVTPGTGNVINEIGNHNHPDSDNRSNSFLEFRQQLYRRVIRDPSKSCKSHYLDQVRH